MNTLKKLENNGVVLKYNDIDRLCKKYAVSELSIFGSSLRDDFTDKSDIDILVSYKDLLNVSIFDVIDFENDLSRLVNRKAQIVIKESLKNPIRKKRILSTMEIVYVD